MQTLKLTKKYETYPEYVASGYAWLGEVPKDWRIGKVKEVFNLIKDKSFNNSETEVLSLTLQGIKVRDISNNEGQIASSYEGYRKINKGDIVLNPMDLIRGFVDSSKFEGIISPAYSTLRKRNADINSEFYNYFFQKHYNEQIFFPFGNGVSVDHRWTLKDNTLLDFPLIINSSEEQSKIANYLDEKTSLIDQIIEKKQKLIELLKEKRTAVINEAVNNVNGEFGKIKNYIEVNPTKKFVSKTELDSIVSFVPMEAMSETGVLSLQEKKYSEVKDGFTYFRNNDVVLAKITPCYENGKAGVMKGLKNDFGFGTTEFMVLRTNDQIIPEYLYYIIFSDKFRKSGEVEMRGTAGQKRVTSSFVRNYEFILPSIEMQMRLVTELNRKTKYFDESVHKVKQSIQLLQEFKSSLISNVVTGKIKIN